MTETIPMAGAGERSAAVHIAVVTSGKEVLWIGAADTRRQLAGDLSDFLVPRCAVQLWEDGAAQFLRLLDQGQPERAVDLYFALVGERWDFDRLTVVTRSLHDRRADRPAKKSAARVRSGNSPLATRPG
jgi:hypothetical protein